MQNTHQQAYECVLTDLLSPFSATVIKIEGKYDIVIKDDELEGTVVNGRIWVQTSAFSPLNHFLLSLTHQILTSAPLSKPHQRCASLLMYISPHLHPPQSNTAKHIVVRIRIWQI